MKRKLLIIFSMIFLLVCFLAMVTLAQEGKPEVEPADIDVGTSVEQAASDVRLATVSSAFTYQGRLTEAGSVANGTFDLRFTLFDVLSGGTQVGSTITLNDVTVSDGIFSVALDFGASFDGNGRWLEIEVRPGASSGSYTSLSPRTVLTAAPYALGLRPGAVIEGETAPFTGVVTGRTSSPDGYGLHGDSAAGYGVGGTGAVGLWGSGNTDGIGVFGTSVNGNGVYASSTNAAAVQASSVNDIGVSGSSTTKIGVLGQSSTSSSTAGEAVGVKGISSGSEGEGVYGQGRVGVYGSGTYIGMAADGVSIGIHGRGNDISVWGANESTAANVIGVYGTISTINAGSSSAAVYGYNWGTGASGIGVWGQQDGTGYGVYGYTPNGGYAVVGESPSSGYAGFFKGNVHVNGTLSKGGGSFKIDHPLDPANKYLSHSFVESPDMMNIYNGNVTTDSEGFATVTMPDWFEALNQDFRYQLTVMGQFAQAIIADEISGNQFRIQTDQPLVKVSWQVTGIRHDPFAEANRIAVEEDKTGDEKGHYLYPEVYGKAPRNSVWHASSPNASYVIDHPEGPELAQPAERVGAE